MSNSLLLKYILETPQSRNLANYSKSIKLPKLNRKMLNRLHDDESITKSIDGNSINTILISK